MTQDTSKPGSFDLATQQFLDSLDSREFVDPQTDGIDAFRRSSSALQIESAIEQVDLAVVKDFQIAGRAGSIPARYYSPRKPEIGGPLPVLLFLHGGAWVIGDIESYDSTCRYLSAAANMICVSLDYRLAPEHPFPAATDDALDAANWLFDHAETIGGDPNKISVAGDSAGGTLAATTCQQVAQKSEKNFLKQVLIYPCLDPLEATQFPSRSVFGDGGYFLDSAGLKFMADLYVTDPTQHDNPAVWPALAADLEGQPDTLIVLAELDLLRDEGIAYVERLRAVGTNVDLQIFFQTIHGFVAFAGKIPSGRTALDNIAGFLKGHL